MPALEMLPLFLIAATALALTPGPDMAFTLATSASRGSRAGLAAVAGIISGGARGVPRVRAYAIMSLSVAKGF